MSDVISVPELTDEDLDSIYQLARDLFGGGVMEAREAIALATREWIACKMNDQYIRSALGVD